MNPKTRNDFYQAINNLITKLDFIIISSVINKQALKSNYPDPISPYDLTLMFIMERLCHFLRVNNGTAELVAESRGKQPDMDLFSYYNRYYEYGTYYRCSSEFKQHLSGICFRPKKENIGGLQIADLVAYPLANQAASRTNTQQSYDIIRPKIYGGYRGKPASFGFKIFP